MRIKVTKRGVIVPKKLLEGVDEVEVRKEHNVIIILPVRPDDPILELGKYPIIDEIDDASINHDHYLYS
jgi:hypothetical protein